MMLSVDITHAFVVTLFVPFNVTCNNLYVNPVDIYLLKVNNRSTRTRCEICSKLTIKTPERRQ